VITPEFPLTGPEGEFQAEPVPLLESPAALVGLLSQFSFPDRSREVMISYFIS